MEVDVKILNIDDLLKNFGLTREMMVQKNEAYAADFKELDKYYDRYNSQPSPGIANAVNIIVLDFMAHLKKANPELFEAHVEQIKESEKVDGKFAEQKKDLIFFIEQGNQDAIDDLFSEVGKDKTKRLLSFDNYKAYMAALKTRSTLVINYLTQTAEELGIFSEMMVGRDGIVLNQIFAGGDKEFIKKALSVLKDHPDEAKVSLKKINALEQVMEMQDEELTESVEILYEQLGVDKKVKGERASKVAKEQSSIKGIVDDVIAGRAPFDTPLVSRLEKKTAIRMLTTPEQIAAGEAYQYVVQTPFRPYFEGKEIYSDDKVTILENKPNEFEKQFGCAIYELGIAWFNIKNLLSVDDLLAMMYLANISQALLTARDNPKLRDEYKIKLKETFNNPEANRIGNRFYQLTQTNIKSLQRSGFLDIEYCPTKLMYCAVVLHSFPFPAYTHPFEFVSIDVFSSLFQFQVLKGEFGNESFYTDGDILYHNFKPGANPPASTMGLIDLSRTVILNLKSKDRSDVKKSEAKINNFMPFIFSVPRAGHNIPSFNIQILEVQNRKINWGVYEFTNDNGDTVYVNSYGIDNFLSRIKDTTREVSIYKGHLSDQIFNNPKEGIIVSYDKKIVVARGINKTSLLSENYGKNWERYYDEMMDKKHLENQVFKKLKVDFIKALYVNTDTRVDSINPNLLFKNLKKYETPIEFKKATKQEPIKKVVVPDDRVYISKQQARQDLNRALLPIFDKVENITGIQRDEAILDSLHAANIDRIFPDQLILLGFDLKQWAITKSRVNFQNKYKLTIPNLLSWTYYIEKL